MLSLSNVYIVYPHSIPGLKTVATVEICTLHAVEQGYALAALGTHAHLHPCAPVVLPSTSAVQPVLRSFRRMGHIDV